MMRDGDWNHDWGFGMWWMAVMMIAFWGGIILLAVTMFRRDRHLVSPNAGPVVPPKLSPEEILADRLARGEIEPADYRSRLDALRHKQDG